MNIEPFKLERYFAKYEFSAPYLLSCSDCEPLMMKELLDMADDETRELWENLWLGYTETLGHPELRQEISQLYAEISLDDILVVTPEEGIFLAMNSLLEPGDHVVTMYPGYQSLYEIAKSQQCEVTHWFPQEGMIFDVDDLEKHVCSTTKLLVINFPHNPSGAMISREQLDQIISIAAQNDIAIFSDEMYRLLEYSPEIRLPSISDIYPKGISLAGLSKTFALPGLRIGWLTTRNKVFFEKVRHFKDYTTICSSAPSEILAIMALRNRDTILQRNLGIIRHNLSVLNDFFQSASRAFFVVCPTSGPDRISRSLD